MDSIKGTYKSDKSLNSYKVKKVQSIILMISLLSSLLIGCGTKADAVSQKMIDDINNLGEITLEDEGDVNKLIERYSTLTDSQKESVKNYASLLEAQDKIEELKKDNEQELLSQENVQMCLGILRDIKSSLKHPDSIEIKKVLNRDYIANSGFECTEFYLEYEAANDVGGMIKEVVFAKVRKTEDNTNSTSVYYKDRGFFSRYYDSEALHWQEIIKNKSNEATEIDATIIQNNL